MSQDTSAYGVDVRYRTGFWQGRPVKTRMTELARELDALARAHGAWVRLHYVYPYPHVDDVIALMRATAGCLVPYLDVPFQHASPRILKLMKRPASAENACSSADQRVARGAVPSSRSAARSSSGFPGETEAEFDGASRVPRRGAARPRRLLRLFAGRRRGRQRAARSRPRGRAGRAPRALHGDPGADQRRAPRAQGRHDDARAGRRGREPIAPSRARRADAPEIDGIVRIANASSLRVGNFADVRITGADAHDLTAQLA